MKAWEKKLLGMRFVYWFLVGFALCVAGTCYLMYDEYTSRPHSYSGGGLNYSTGDDNP